MTRCIADKTAGQTSSECPTDPDEISQNIRTWSDLFLEEQEASHGISSAVRLGPVDLDQLEIHSSSRSAAMDTLLGALIGILAAFAIVWFPESRKESA